VIKMKVCYFLSELPSTEEQDAMNDAILKSTIALGFLGLIPVVAGGNDGYFLTDIKDIRKRKNYKFTTPYHYKFLISILTVPFVFFEARESRITKALDPYLDMLVFQIAKRELTKNESF